MLAEFRDQVRAYGLGERLWQCHAGEFAMMTGDLTALEEHLERFRAAERDDVSDCAVCETGAMAEYLLALGRRTEGCRSGGGPFAKEGVLRGAALEVPIHPHR
ncbi:MAG: hypothetical protein ACLUJG_16825 [Lawsonibacter sp.]